VHACALVVSGQGPQGTAGANGQPGATGAAGAAGTAGIHCWDLNQNGACDLNPEDVNLDGACTVLDCRGRDGTGSSGPSSFPVSSCGANQAVTGINSNGAVVCSRIFCSSNTSASARAWDDMNADAARPSQTSANAVTDAHLALQAGTCTTTPLPSNSAGSSLSGGAVAGIVIGVLMAVAAVLVGGYVVMRKRRRGAQFERGEMAMDTSLTSLPVGSSSSNLGASTTAPSAPTAANSNAADGVPVGGGWVQYIAEGGDPYYYNAATKQTVWQLPTGATLTR